MPRNDEPRLEEDAARVAAPSSSVGQTIDLPRPTQDQEKYLEKIKRSTGNYDPNVVVGGPRRTTA
ncbi:MAG: hypothetical protein ACLPKT_13355 [Methylocella sp.]